MLLSFTVKEIGNTGGGNQVKPNWLSSFKQMVVGASNLLFSLTGTKCNKHKIFHHPKKRRGKKKSKSKISSLLSKGLHNPCGYLQEDNS
jgi:hypothetical protein